MINMANVYFLRETHKIKEALNILNVQDFKDQRTPIKLHFGEPGNKYYIPSRFVKTVLRTLKDVGAKPFLFDTTVLYSSPRSTIKGYEQVARKHGFGVENIGCETIIGEEGVEVVDFGHRG